MPDLPVFPLNMLLGASRARSYQDRTMRTARTLLDFLSENGLLLREVHEVGSDPPRELCLMRSDLTAEGNAVMDLALMKWLKAHDRGTKIETVSRLERALAQVHRGQK